MGYCTKDDVYKAVGETHAKSMATDASADIAATKEARIDEAIARASDRIDTFLRGRYTLPLTNVPGVLTDYCVQITIYNLASRKGIDQNGAEKTIKDNHDTALRELKLIAEGVLDIGILSNDGKSTPQVTPLSSFPVSRFDAEDY